MKFFVITCFLLVFVAGMLLGYIAPRNDFLRQEYENGIYRGVFLDKGHMEVNVQFALEDNLVQDARYRYLWYDGTDYMQDSSLKSKIVRWQFQELLDHLSGRNMRVHISDLYTPGQIITSELDGITGATVRSGKVVSAIQDALNRGVYSQPE